MTDHFPDARKKDHVVETALTITRETAVDQWGGCSLNCGWCYSDDCDTDVCFPGLAVFVEEFPEMRPGPGCPRFKG